MSTRQITQKVRFETGRWNPAPRPTDRAIQYDAFRPRWVSPVTEDHELASLARAVVWLVILGIAPLILFLISLHLDSNLFMISGIPE